MYSDASFERRVLHLSVVLASGHALPSSWRDVFCPRRSLGFLKPRSQQYFPREALCLLVLLALFPHSLKGQDWPWLHDNQVTIATAVKGYLVRAGFVQRIHYSAILRLRLGAPAWHDGVDADSNVGHI